MTAAAGENGAGEGGQEGGQEGSGSGAKSPDKGNYTAPASQADLDKIVEARLARERSKWGDVTPDLLKQLGITDAATARTFSEAKERQDALELELSSEADKKAAEARKTALSEADAKYQSKLVETAFRIAIGDRMPEDERDEFISDQVSSRCLTDQGDVDTKKVLARVEKYLGKAPTAPTRVGPSPSGQGNRPANGNAGDPARAWLAKQGIKVD